MLGALCVDQRPADPLDQLSREVVAGEIARGNLLIEHHFGGDVIYRFGGNEHAGHLGSFHCRSRGQGRSGNHGHGMGDSSQSCLRARAAYTLDVSPGSCCHSLDIRSKSTGTAPAPTWARYRSGGVPSGSVSLMLSRERLRRHTALVSSVNVELVRSIYAAWERGDYSGSLGWASSDIEFVFGDGPDPGKWVGLGVMVQHWREQLGPWEDLRVQAREYRELDHERIVRVDHDRLRLAVV